MRAGFIGYNVRLYKFLVFVISASIAGLAGGLFSMAQQGAYPECDESACFRLRGNDDAYRRRLCQLLGSGPGNGRVLSGPGLVRCDNSYLAALVWSDVHGNCDIQARGHCRYLAGPVATMG